MLLCQDGLEPGGLMGPTGMALLAVDLERDACGL